MAATRTDVDERTTLLGNSNDATHTETSTIPEDQTRMNDDIDDPKSQLDDLPTSRLTLILGSCYLGEALSAIDGTMVATLTASISSALNSRVLVAWLAAAYFISNGMINPLVGKLTDIYGRKTGLMVCNVLFGLGQLICGLSGNAATIITGRVITGIGGGGLNAIPMMVTHDLVPLRRRGVWQGWINAAYGTGAAIGGVFGGQIHDALSWRWAFIIMVPLTGLSIFLTFVFLKAPEKEVNEQDTRAKYKRLDFLGSITLTAAIALLCFGLTLGGSTVSWNHPLVLITISLSLVSFIIFVWVEIRYALEPVVPMHLFLNRTVASACVTLWLASAAQASSIIFLPIYIQVKGGTVVRAGLFLLPHAIGALTGSMTSGYIMRATGKYYVLNIATQLLFSIPFGLMIKLTRNSPDILPIIYYVSTGVAYSAILTVSMTALIAATEHKDQALVTSASFAFRTTGMTVGITLCSVVFQNVLARTLSDRFGHEDNAAELISRLRDSLSAIDGLPTEYLRDQAREAYMEALTGVFGTVFALAATGALVSLLWKQYTLHQDLARRGS